MKEEEGKTDERDGKYHEERESKPREYIVEERKQKITKLN